MIQCEGANGYQEPIHDAETFHPHVLLSRWPSPRSVQTRGGLLYTIIAQCGVAYNSHHSIDRKGFFRYYVGMCSYDWYTREQ